MAAPGFWDDQQQAQKLIDANNALKQKYDAFQNLQNQGEDLQVSLELLQEEPDDEMMHDFETD